MQEYKLQIKGKWKSFTVPQMVQAIYAAQHRVHWTAYAVLMLGFFVLGVLVGWFVFGC